VFLGFSDDLLIFFDEFDLAGGEGCFRLLVKILLKPAGDLLRGEGRSGDGHQCDDCGDECYKLSSVTAGGGGIFPRFVQKCGVDIIHGI